MEIYSEIALEFIEDSLVTWVVSRVVNLLAWDSVSQRKRIQLHRDAFWFFRCCQIDQWRVRKDHSYSHIVDAIRGSISDYMNVTFHFSVYSQGGEHRCWCFRQEWSSMEVRNCVLYSCSSSCCERGERVFVPFYGFFLVFVCFRQCCENWILGFNWFNWESV